MTDGSLEPAAAGRSASRRPSHRRSRSLWASGRHRARHDPVRWLVPALLAVGILASVLLVLVVIDATTATAITPFR